jgi:Glycosyltransferase
MKNLKIIFVSIFSDISSINNSRISNIYNSFANFEREIITADFDHTLKRYKEKDNFVIRKYIHVPGYKNNISLKRLYSHIVFAIKLRKYLNGMEEVPAIIYCSMPSSFAAYICGKYCQKNKAKFVIDVIDLWPDSLLPISPIFKLLKPFTYFWGLITNKAYGLADYISAESKKYMEVALSKSGTNNYSYTYLGIDLNHFDNLLQQSKIATINSKNEIWICYGGNLGNSYDFDSILNAIQHVDLNGIKYKFWFVGGGEKHQEIENYSQKHNLNVEITGFISYPDYLKHLSNCDIAINSFKKSTKVVYSFKFNDYVGTHLFVLNSLKGETAEMVQNYLIGLNYETDSLPDVLLSVCQNWKSYKLWKENTIPLIENCLNTKIIYENLKNDILLKLGF